MTKIDNPCLEHTFSNWRQIAWITKEAYFEDGYFDVTHTIWKRICSNCGFEEITAIEPAEIKQARLEREKKELTKYLKY